MKPQPGSGGFDNYSPDVEERCKGDKTRQRERSRSHTFDSDDDMDFDQDNSVTDLFASKCSLNEMTDQ